MSRARLYFDGRKRQQPYINHLFRIHPYPQTFYDQTGLNNRRQIDFRIRNPPMLQVSVNSILRIHVDDYTGHGEDDIYRDYVMRGMSSAEYYFERHIDQFYRTLFFFFELQSRNIEDIEFESNIEMIRSSLPRYINEMLYLDQAYGYYLRFLRVQLYKRINSHGADASTSILECLSTARAREEDLISLFSLFIGSNQNDTGLIRVVSIQLRLLLP